MKIILNNDNEKGIMKNIKLFFLILFLICNISNTAIISKTTKYCTLDSINHDISFDSNSLWINKEFKNYLINSKSIYNSIVKIKDEKLVLIEKVSSKNYKIIETSDFNDSEVELYSFFKNSNKKYFAQNYKSKKKILLLNDSTIRIGSINFEKIHRKNPKMDEVNQIISELFLTGLYVDSLTSRIIEITPTAFISNNDTLFKYQLGISVIDVECDYILFDMKYNTDFKNIAYSFYYLNGLFYFCNIIDDKNDISKIGNKNIFILKRIK